MKQKKVGFTIGKFAPFHKGHQLLIETGLKEMDKFYVIVYETDVIDIDIEIRANWIKQIYPDVEIRFAKNPPKQYGLDEQSVKIQMEYLGKIIEDINPTHFYSSEPYGKYVANYLKIEDRQVDKNREYVPISATKIRNDLDLNKIWLEDIVYKDYKRNINKSRDF